MKQWMLIALLLVPFESRAHGEDVPMDTAQQLREWCEKESQAWFVGRDLSAYNWTASWWEEGNLFKVKGSWRVGTKDYAVECRIARGAETRYAVMEVH